MTQAGRERAAASRGRAPARRYRHQQQVVRVRPRAVAHDRLALPAGPLEIADQDRCTFFGGALGLRVGAEVEAARYKLNGGEGTLLLGTWQGIYLWEHRGRPHRREIAAHLIGE